MLVGAVFAQPLLQ